MKGKGNPVTEADIEADEILKEIVIMLNQMLNFYINVLTPK